jgi:hypothetical protein
MLAVAIPVCGWLNFAYLQCLASGTATHHKAKLCVLLRTQAYLEEGVEFSFVAPTQFDIGHHENCNFGKYCYFFK